MIGRMFPGRFPRQIARCAHDGPTDRVRPPRTRVRAAVVAAVVLLLAGSGVSEAQITGSVAGSVRDEGGGALAGAALVLRERRCAGPISNASTGPDGAYRFLLVPAGTYEIRVALAGFTSQMRTDVEVAINRQTTLDFALALAGVSELVTVTTGRPLVDVTRTDVASRVQARVVDALPLNGRNFVDLVGLAPGALPGAGGPAGRQRVDFRRAGRGAVVPRRRCREQRPAERRALGPAEPGRGTGIRGHHQRLRRRVRPGPGRRHQPRHPLGHQQRGRARVRVLPQRSARRLERARPGSPALDRTQWGGTLGGPIARDRLFFFASAEALDETRGVNLDRASIPAFVAGGLATPGGTEDFDQAPETTSLAGLIKLDWTITDRHRAGLAGSLSNLDQQGELSSPVAGTIPLPSAARTQIADAFRVAARGTSLLRSSAFLESTAIFIKGRGGSNLERAGRPEPILVLLRSGFVQTGAPFEGKTDRTTARVQVTQSLGHYARGRTGAHQVKAGWDANHVTVDGFNSVTNDLEVPRPRFCQPTRTPSTPSGSRASGSRSPPHASSRCPPTRTAA